MNLLNKLTIKNLKLNKKRTIVTVIGIMLSVALITAVASIYASGVKSLIKLEAQQQGNFHTAFYNVPVSDLNQFKENRNIETISVINSIGYAKIESKNEYKPYAHLEGFTKDSLNNLSVKLVKGKLPQNENEIVIPTTLQTNGRSSLNVGNSITLNVGKRVNNTGEELNQDKAYENDERIIETTKKTYKIVGIIERPAYSVEPYSAPGYTFITYLDESKINGNIDVYVRFTKDGLKNYYETIANILGVNPKLYEKVNKNLGTTSNEDMDEYTKQMEKAKYQTIMNGYLISLETDPSTGGLDVVMGIIIGIIVFTSIFCIKNSFDISITEKIKQYGMLRSIGATKKQIKKNVFYEATILGIIGIPLGILLGIMASFILIIISNYYLAGLFIEGIELEFVISWLAIIVAIILGIITIYFSAFRSAKRASKVSPIDSIRNSANIKINPKKIKSPKLIKKLFGIGGEISYKNLKRNKKKYRTTVISMIVSVFVFIALSGFMVLAFQKVEHEINISDFNISLRTNDMNKDSYNKYIETTKLDDVSDYTLYRDSRMSFTGTHYSKEYRKFFDIKQDINEESSIDIISIGDKQYQKYVKALGYNYDDIKNKAILIDHEYVTKVDKNKKAIKKYMRHLDFEKGDTIDATITSTEKQVKIEVGAISEVVPFGMKDIPASCIIVSDKMFDDVAISSSLNIYYKVNDANEFQNELEDYLKGENYSINNIDENIKKTSNFLTLIGIFLYGFIIVISLIGITNIFNTITTNMELRKQEFATLKSVGMTTKEFNRMIRLESIFMGVKALFFGIPIGIGLSYLIYHFLSSDEGLPYKMPVLAIIISIIAIFLLISLVMKYSMSKINKQNTIETIRNENI